MLAGIDVPTAKSFLHGAAPLAGEGAVGSGTGVANCMVIDLAEVDMMLVDRRQVTESSRKCVSTSIRSLRNVGTTPKKK